MSIQQQLQAAQDRGQTSSQEVKALQHDIQQMNEARRHDEHQVHRFKLPYIFYNHHKNNK